MSTLDNNDIRLDNNEMPQEENLQIDQEPEAVENCQENGETGVVNAGEPAAMEIEKTAVVETEEPVEEQTQEQVETENVPAIEPATEEPAETTAEEPIEEPAETTVEEPELIEQTNRNYAGFFPRMIAFGVDSLLAFLVGLLFKLLPLVVEVVGVYDPTQPLLFTFSAYDIIAYVGATLYFVLLTYFKGATIGKRLMNLKVVTLSTRGKFLDILFRETIGRYLSSILCIGYVVGGFDIERRCFHDSLADTRVVYNVKT